MKDSTKATKEANQALKAMCEATPMFEINDLIMESKTCFDSLMGKLKLQMVEFLLFSEREMLSGPDYDPKDGIKKWGIQGGSVYVGGERLKVKKPRLRSETQELKLSVYESLKDREKFSKELLLKALSGISTRDYQGTLHFLLEAFGISKSSVSRHLVEASAKELKELNERSLKDFEPFAIFLDGYHLCGKVFIVGLGVDINGKKKSLGFWEGATENHAVCEGLLRSLERRGLKINNDLLWITDGGSGIIKTLRERFGKKLVHQRCTLHKDRNIQKHLAKKYRKEAHEQFKRAVDCYQYQDAKEELTKMEAWLEKINPSAAESLREGQEELLTVHRLEVPPLLRTTVQTTNPIESMFSSASHGKRNLKNLKGKNTAQRWMGASLLYAEGKFRTVKGYFAINEVKCRIKAYQERQKEVA